MTRRLLLVAPAGSYRVGDHLAAAQALGCAVTVVTDAAVAIGGSAVVTDLTDPPPAADRVLAALDGPVDGAIGTDGAAVPVAGELARRLKLPANPAAALRAADDKLAQRRALARAGVPQPAFAVLAGEDDDCGWDAALELLPAVVKPVDRTASQGVLGAETPAALRTAVARVRRLVGADASVLVERLVPGVEVAVEGLLRGGRLQVIATFDKPDTSTGPTFPETLLHRARAAPAARRGGGVGGRGARRPGDRAHRGAGPRRVHGRRRPGVVPRAGRPLDRGAVQPLAADRGAVGRGGRHPPRPRARRAGGPHGRRDGGADAAGAGGRAAGRGARRRAGTRGGRRHRGGAHRRAGQGGGAAARRRSLPRLRLRAR